MEQTLDKTTSPFKVGVKIAIVGSNRFGDRGIQPGTVTTVTPTGRFKIKYDHGHEPEGYFRPEILSVRHGTWIAHKTGDRFGAHVEMWTADIEKEVAARNKKRRANALRSSCIDKIQSLSLSDGTNQEKLDQIAVILGIPSPVFPGYM